MSEFNPAADEGQAGWVQLPDGRIAYRYLDADADDLIVQDAP